MHLEVSNKHIDNKFCLTKYQKKSVEDLLLRTIVSLRES